MGNVIDYVKWRGDLSLERDPFNRADAIVFSCLSYLVFVGSAAEEPHIPITIRRAFEELQENTDAQIKTKNQSHMELLKACAASERFGTVTISHYRSQFVPEEDTQFSATCFHLSDHLIVPAFRGTDTTLVGWKEDFNMCFQQTVPSQRLAAEYIHEVYSEYMCEMIICGHSKGGNLAIFAAARSSPMVQELIRAVYCNDGPGFSDYMMGDPGYLAMVPKIDFLVPQTSIIGLIMDHEEEYTVVKSIQTGLRQHDMYTWEVLGKELVILDDVTTEARIIQGTFKNWLMGMNTEERNQMVEAVFELLMNGENTLLSEALSITKLRSYYKLLSENDSLRKRLSGDLTNLIDAARKSVQTQLGSQNEPLLNEQNETSESKNQQ